MSEQIKERIRITEQTYNLLRNKYKIEIDDLVISDIRIGLYLTAVGLSDGSVGTCSTLVNEQPVCIKGDRDFGDFTPLKIKGQKVMDILGTDKESNLLSSLKTAVLNALSSKVVLSGNYRIIEDCDPIQLIDLEIPKTITIVGAFHSYIRKISPTNNKLFVLELTEKALPGELKKYYVQADDYKKTFSVSDVVIITGQTLVNKTIDDLLSAVLPGTMVIVCGPSGNIIPDILFENNVSIIGATKINKPDVLFDLVGEGGTVFHLFEYCAQKICILKGDEHQA